MRQQPLIEPALRRSTNAFDVDPDLLTVEYVGTEEVDESSDGAGLAYFTARLVADGDCAADIPDPSRQDVPRQIIATARLVDVRPELLCRHAAVTLDEVSNELGAYGVLFGDRGWVRNDLPGDLSCTALVIVARVQVAPAWRGRRLGQLLTAVALRRLAGGDALVAGTPVPFELAADDPHRAGKTAQLRSLWRDFGFTEWQDDPDMLLLDMATTTIDNTHTRLRAVAGRLPG